MGGWWWGWNEGDKGEEVADDQKTSGKLPHAQGRLGFTDNQE